MHLQPPATFSTSGINRLASVVLRAGVLACSILSPFAVAAPLSPAAVTIAVVRDGDAPSLHQLDVAIRQEVNALAGERFAVRFDDAPTFNARWNAAAVAPALDAALADSSIDCVLVLGPQATLAAADPARPLDKPVFGALVQDPDLVSLPIDAAGHTRKPNFAVIALPSRAIDQLRELRGAVPFTALHVLANASTDDDRRAFESWRASLARHLDVPVTLVPVAAGVDDTLAQIDASAETILLTPLPQLGADEHAALLRGLTERRLRVLTLAGQPDVAAGALAGVLPDTLTALARRVAINFDQWVGGTAVAELPLHASVATQLFFNESTAAAIGFTPQLRELATATLVDRITSTTGNELTFADAVFLALERNYDYLARQAGTAASREAVAAARGALLPQVGASHTYQQIDRDRALSSGGALAESSLRSGVSITQTLVDDEAFTRVRTARATLKAADYTEQVERFDTINSAGQAYLQLLSALATLRATEENSRVTEHNLELARLRQRVGTAGPEEGYRFESQSAQQRADLAEAESQVNRARVELNRALGTDIAARWDVRDVTLHDPAFAFSMDQVAGLVGNRTQLDRFRAFIGEFAVEHSPDLAAFDQNVNAQRLTAAQKRRRSYVPKVAASFDYSRTLSDEYAVSLPQDPSRNAWTFAVTASIPLFSGGSVQADARRAQAELTQMELSRDGLREAVIAQAQSSLYAIDSAYANIDLSRRSADLAQRNLEVIQRKYEHGAVSVVTLLDAQNAAFAQRQAADIAVYRLFSAILTLQRVFGWYELLATPDEKAAWLDRLLAATSA